MISLYVYKDNKSFKIKKKINIIINDRLIWPRKLYQLNRSMKN